MADIVVQDVVDNHEEAATAAPFALRLCQMVFALTMIQHLMFTLHLSRGIFNDDLSNDQLH